MVMIIDILKDEKNMDGGRKKKKESDKFTSILFQSIEQL